MWSRQAAQKERPGLIAADKSHAQLLADPLKPIPKPVGVKKYTSTGRAYDSPLHKKEVKQTLGLDDNDWKGISACAREQVRAFQLDAKDSKNKTIPWPDKLAANKKGAMDTLKTAWPILKRAVDRWAAKFFLTSQANNRKDESEEPEVGQDLCLAIANSNDRVQLLRRQRAICSLLRRHCRRRQECYRPRQRSTRQLLRLRCRPKPYQHSPQLNPPMLNYQRPRQRHQSQVQFNQQSV